MSHSDTKAIQHERGKLEPLAAQLPTQQPSTSPHFGSSIAALQAGIGNAALAAAATHGSLGPSARLRPVQSPSGNAAVECSLQPQHTRARQAASPPLDSRASGPRLPADRSLPLQPKLTIGAAHDQYEQEADRVAQQVMRMPPPPYAVTTQGAVQQQTPAQDEVAQTKPLAATITPLVQRASADATGSFAPGADFEARLRTSDGGSPLPASTRAFMEPRFGADFSGVRLHSGSEAAQLTRAVSAQAFTQGQDIYLGEGKTNLESSTGKQLLAHELTHTIQQGAVGTLDPAVQRARLPSVDGGLIQRDGDDATSAGAFNVPTLDQLYNTALQAARQTGNWQDAAEKLNGFNHEDIQSRLAQLTQDEVGYLHQGALDNPRVGPDSHVAQLTKLGTPRASTAPPTASKAPVAPPATKSVPVTDGAEKPVAEMTKFEKLSRAIDWARVARDGALRTQLDALKTPQAIFTMVAFALLFIGAQFTPVGWIADAFALTLLTLTVVFTGALVIQVFANLGKFIGAINATTDDELKEAGEALADAVATGGIALVIGLLTHAGRAVPPGRAPFRAPPSEGFLDALTADGELVRIPKETQEAAPVDRVSNQSRGSGSGKRRGNRVTDDENVPDRKRQRQEEREQGRASKEAQQKDPQDIDILNNGYVEFSSGDRPRPAYKSVNEALEAFRKNEGHPDARLADAEPAARNNFHISGPHQGLREGDVYVGTIFEGQVLDPTTNEVITVWTFSGK